MPINLNSTFSLTPGCEVTSTADGVVIYQVAREKIHQLNATAAIVYRLCGERASVENIIENLQNAFALQEPPRVEVHRCIERLLAEGLIAPGGN